MNKENEENEKAPVKNCVCSFVLESKNALLTIVILFINEKC